jgi:hypothetical protein
VLAPEITREFRRYSRKLERELQRDKRKLFQALQEFANIRPEKEALIHFRRLWPNFFPESEYDNAARGSSPNILGYPDWLHQVWIGGETEPHLKIMLGLEDAPVDGTPEDSWAAGLSSISAKFCVDWDEGVFFYEGGCDFQRALYLLFRESWRARICEKCSAKFIARRAAQKYCTTDCSENMQRELKQKWWAEHGEEWRKRRHKSNPKRKGGKNGTHKTR